MARQMLGGGESTVLLGRSLSLIPHSLMHASLIIFYIINQRRPKKGSALLFFPAAGGIPNAPFDIRTLHCGEVVAEDSEQEKWIAQLWLRQRKYSPTAPVGNIHGDATSAIGRYCDAGTSVT